MTVADLFITSRYLQHLRGYSALETGLFFLPTALATMVGAILRGRLAGTIGTCPVAFAGLALVVIGNGLLIGFSADGNVFAQVLPGGFVHAERRPGARRRGRGGPHPLENAAAPLARGSRLS